MKKLLVSLGLMALLAQSALAFRPAGWVYFNYPWAYDNNTRDWYWFNTSDTQWIANMGSGQWAKLQNSALASGWVYYAGTFAYAQGNSAWHWVNEADTQWVVNMRTGAWTRFGADTAQTSDYLVIDLAEGSAATNYPVSYLDDVPAGGWTDEYKTTKLVMRRIPAGTFMMGSPDNELGRQSNETQREVTLTQDYYMGVFPVTQMQWERVMGNWPSYFNNVDYRDARPVEQVTYYEIRENSDSNSAISPNWPQSSEAGASSFVGKLRERTGLTTLDLPTEAQWERAARAGTTTALNSGKNLTETLSCPNMSEVGRYHYNHPGGFAFSSNVSTDGATAKVGSYISNAWGLYDMHGNVSEWCLDWVEDLHDQLLDPSGAASGSYRMLRGGAFNYAARDCRSAVRSGDYPSYGYSYFGFRLSRTLP